MCVLGTLYSLSADLNSGSYASPVQFVLFHDAWCSHSRQIYSTFKHVERWVDKSYHSPYCDVTLNAQDVKFLAVCRIMPILTAVFFVHTTRFCFRSMCRKQVSGRTEPMLILRWKVTR